MNNNGRIPEIFKWLFKKIIPFYDREMFFNYMEEEYNHIYSEKGRNKANRRLWSHLLRSLPSFFKTNFIWSFTMFTNYLKIALRNIKRHRFYSFINISGLAVGIACFILIMLFVQYEFGYEKHHKNLDRIYRVNIKYLYPDNTVSENYTQAPLAEVLMDEIPEILNAARFAGVGSPLIRYKNNNFYEPDVIFTDASTFKIFTFSFIKGNKKDALKDKYSLVITEEKAEKYFGNEDPVGKVVTLNGNLELTVTGVIKNIPENSMFQYGFFISYPTIEDVRGSRFMTNRLSIVLRTFVLFSSDVNPSDILKKTNFVFKSFYPGDGKVELFFQPLKSIHLYSELDNYGSIKHIYIFSIAALFIILIACINYMNLSTARSEKRAREVGIRKVSGATRTALIKQFFGETIIFTLISLIIAVIIVIILLPFFRNLTGQDIKLESLTSSIFILGLPVITLFAGLLSGSYPAVFLSSFKPVKILKGAMKSGSKGVNFRKILIVVQFAISITLIISTLIISKQIIYLKHKNLGFNKDQLLVIKNHGEKFAENLGPLKNELQKSPDIFKISGSGLLPGRGYLIDDVTWEGAQEEQIAVLAKNFVDYDFLETYGIELIEGRYFSPSFTADEEESIVINEAAAKKFGWTNSIGKKVYFLYGGIKNEKTVIGVVRDFHFASLKNKIEPFVFLLRKRNLRYISLRVNTENITGTIKYAGETWNRLNPGFPFEYFFLDETFNRMYVSEERMRMIFSYFSFLTIFISCLGLFGLISYAAEQKTKEIGIRKVLGASIGNIILLLSKEFMIWVVIANIVSWPIAYYYMNNWMREFAYRTSIGIDAFILSTIISIIIAFFTVSYQSIKAATANPVNSIRNE